MFAPLVTKPQTKAALRSSDTSASRRTAAHDLDPDIERQQASQRVPQTGLHSPPNEPRPAAWHFSNIPVYPLGRGSWPERPSAAPATACSGKTMVGLQAKLRINGPDDAYEREADRVAGQVVSRPASRSAGDGPPRIQRYAPNESGQAHAVPASVERVLAGPGRPLEPAVSQDMEQRFGHDFSRVRVHSGAAAEQSAREVNALAYTVGPNVVFGEGRFAPGTSEGRRLIAHELTHVLQQSSLEGVAPRCLQRETGGGATPPKPPYLSGLTATHVEGNIWEIELTGEGPSLVGPYKELAAYVKKLGLGLQAHHIVGEEFVDMVPTGYTADTMPAVALHPDSHARVSAGVNRQMREEGPYGGRAGGRAELSRSDLRELYDEVYGTEDLPLYPGDTPYKELNRIAKNTLKTPKKPTPVTPDTPAAAPAEPTKTAELSDPHASRGGGTLAEVEPPAQTPVSAAAAGPIATPATEAGFLRRGLKTFFRARLRAAKAGIVEGVKGVFSPEGIAALLPEAILTIADRVALNDAIRRIKIKFAKEGLAKGVAAGVAEWSKEEVGSNLKNHVTPFRVQGLEDPAGFLESGDILQLAEAYENYAIDLGYQFSSSKPLKWKGDLRAKGLAALAKRGYHFEEEQSRARAVKRVDLGNVIVEEELDPGESGPEPRPRYLFEYNFIDKLAWVLRDTILNLRGIPLQINPAKEPK
jgi:hypothetical protein